MALKFMFAFSNLHTNAVKVIWVQNSFGTTTAHNHSTISWNFILWNWFNKWMQYNRWIISSNPIGTYNQFHSWIIHFVRCSLRHSCSPHTQEKMTGISMIFQWTVTDMHHTISSIVSSKTTQRMWIKSNRLNKISSGYKNLICPTRHSSPNPSFSALSTQPRMHLSSRN